MKNNTVYLKHILDSINRVEKYISGIKETAFKENALIQAGVCREIEIIGEATKRLSDDFKAKNSAIPWKAMAGMRDKLIHDYFGVDYDAVWDTLIKDIPALKDFIKKNIDGK